MSTAPRRRLARRAGPPLLAAWAWAQSGCCQPCYAPVQPACPPMAARPATVRYGEVCEAAPAGSSAVASAPSKAATMSAAPRPRVVVSEPAGRLAGRSGWRRPDPDTISTRLENTLDDDSVLR